MYRLPCVVIEDGAVSKIDYVKNELCFGNKCLVLCDANLRKIGDKIDGDIMIPDGLERSYIETLSNTIKNYDYVVGVGGGRTIDLTKYASYLAKKPWVSMPTILSHDGVVSNRAAITEQGAKISVDAKEPAGVVVDTEIIKNAPYRYMAAGAADAVSNITSVRDWQLGAERGEEYNPIAAHLAMASAESVVQKADEIHSMTTSGIQTLIWSLIISGLSMNINGSSRPASGSEHNFSHAMEKLNSPLLHGEHCAVGTIVSSYLQNRDWKKIRDVFNKLGVPVSYSQFSEPVKEDLFIDALVMAKDIRGYKRFTILDMVDIDREKARNILETIGFF